MVRSALSRASAAVLSFSLAMPVAACGGPTPAPAAAPSTASAAPSASTAPAAATDAGSATDGDAAATPDTPAGRQLAWVLDALGGGPPPTEGAASTHFTQEFLDKVPASQVVSLLSQVGQQVGPVKLVRVEMATDQALSAVAQSRVGFLRIKLSTETAPPYRMMGLLLQPATDLEPVPASWDEVTSKLHAVAPDVAFLAARLDAPGPAACTKIAGDGETRELAIGSTFKLYVLSALTKQIAQHKHAWTDTLAFDAAKAVPLGSEMVETPPGQTFSLREWASRMISVSDNTAADHLLAFVGRPAVEAEVATSGHSAPARDVPFLSTREMFVYKLLLSPAEQHAYDAADVAGKRRLLEAMDKRDLGPTVALAPSWTTPRFVDTMEWFASPNDLCKVAAELHGMGDDVANILSMNPGVPDTSGQYKYIGYKGGGEAGVMALAWILQRAADGAWLFLAIEYNDTAHAIDEAKGIAAAQAARSFLAKP
jgi:beta-lactamase class A